MIAGVLYFISSNPLALLIPFPTMFARVYFGAHWIGDTVGGLLIGFALGLYVVPVIAKTILVLFGGSVNFL